MKSRGTLDQFRAVLFYLETCAYGRTPQLATLCAPFWQAQVRPSDIAFVRIGQPAHVAITAYDRSVYGVLDGTVTTISPDATVNERTGESYYTVKVRTNVNFLRDNDGRQMPIGVGMTAEVDLLGEKRTILQYILSPISRLGETAWGIQFHAEVTKTQVEGWIAESPHDLQGSRQELEAATAANIEEWNVLGRSVCDSFLAIAETAAARAA